MSIYVGLTDYDWYRNLRLLPDLDEVNFWQPSGGREFQVLPPGGIFLFKLHSPYNVIVGGGCFAQSSSLPASLAWDYFGVKNGAATFDDMVRRLAQIRTIPARGFSSRAGDAHRRLQIVAAAVLL